MMDRVAVLIDGVYLDYGLRDQFGSARLDFHLLAKELAAEKEILRTYYYHCLLYQSDPPTADETDRFSKMQAFMS